jgi:hypothetical protein
MQYSLALQMRYLEEKRKKEQLNLLRQGLEGLQSAPPKAISKVQEFPPKILVMKSICKQTARNLRGIVTKKRHKRNAGNGDIP